MSGETIPSKGLQGGWRVPAKSYASSSAVTGAGRPYLRRCPEVDVRAKMRLGSFEFGYQSPETESSWLAQPLRLGL